MRASSLLEGGAKRLGALFLLGWSVVMVPIGLGLTLWGLFNKIGNAEWEDPLSIGLALVILGGLLWLLSKRLDQAARAVRLRRQENRILRLARQRGGRLMVIETAADTELTAAEAEEILKSLAEGGFVELEVTDSGLIVYRFPEILYEHEIHSSAERIWSAG